MKWVEEMLSPLTSYLSNDPKFGELWNNIYHEYELTKKYVLQLSGVQELMGDYPDGPSLSIAMHWKDRTIAHDTAICHQ